MSRKGYRKIGEKWFSEDELKAAGKELADLFREARKPEDDK